MYAHDNIIIIGQIPHSTVSLPRQGGIINFGVCVWGGGGGEVGGSKSDV